jgi:hypothetical protein
MALSIAQMARMSELLEEALPLDETGRLVWLDKVSKENPDLASVLFDALLPGEAQASKQRMASPFARCRRDFSILCARPYGAIELLSRSALSVWL